MQSDDVEAAAAAALEAGAAAAPGECGTLDPLLTLLPHLQPPPRCLQTCVSACRVLMKLIDILCHQHAGACEPMCQALKPFVACVLWHTPLRMS